MRIALPWLVALVVAASAAAGARASTPPELQANRAEAEAVLQRVNTLGVQFGRVVDRWDGARIALAHTERQLAANRRSLVRARRENRVAQARLAQVLVAVYEHGSPTLPEIVVGASSISDLVDQLEAARTIDAYDKRVVAAARRWEKRLRTVRAALQQAERTRRTTLAQLTRERREIGSMLARRRRLLASVQGEVKVLEAQQAARQHALLVAARQRLAREQAARAAAARIAAERAAAERAAVQTTTAAPTTTTTAVAAPTTVGSTTTIAATTTAAAPPSPAPAPSLPAGYPQAASIALRYLGIKYTWGGASPSTGFDCSGLVMYVYAQLGVQLPHQAAAQYGYGVAVPRSQLQPGDLVFYDGLSHVAIYIGNGEVVHAPQTGDVVKIAPIAQAGGSYVGARRL